MKDTTPTNPELGFSPWQRLKSKRISYLTLPLLIMATITEIVIITTGWKYQQIVCLPPGMAVTFFGIGPIGATILAVELLKLPLAIWTASRKGWAKGVMLVVGLPMICLLTFQLVKDMAVYEMGVALAPASRMLEKATDEEVKIDQLNGELAAIGVKKADRDRKLAELDAKETKVKADLEDSLKRNDDSRQDAISLTDYQKNELSQVDAREATIIQQFNADTAQLTKEIADLRANREVVLARDTKWNAEEARIDNAYKTAMADYENKLDAYKKAKLVYDNANIITRQFLTTPVDPGVPPVRESNSILKPTMVADIDAQIAAKEAELLDVNNKRRDRIAQVEADARQLREEFDQRSTTRRDEADKKREDLLAAEAAVDTDWQTERKQIDADYETAAQKADGIRAELDTAQKQAEGYYEAREADMKNTQVYRIATTVEIVRALIMGQRPVSIKATAKERGDLYTDQITMVRIWVYPVLAFIVAFLPTLMVEVGFSTLFEPEKQRPAYRLGFFGRRMHWLYTRAGRLKILRAERRAKEATAQITARDNALAAAKADAEQVLAAKEVELRAAQEAAAAATAAHEEELKKKEGEWVAKVASLADSLNDANTEKDALRDFQKSEIERQVQLRQNSWSERLTLMRQELDTQHAANEAERAAMLQEHHKKLLEISEDCKTQVMQARRQAAGAELAAEEKTAKLEFDLKEALNARDAARSQLQQQVESLSLKLAQTRDEATREMEKAGRQEKYQMERQQLEFGKTLRQLNEEFEHKLKQREQELSLGFDARLAEELARAEQDARRREGEVEVQLETRIQEVDARWSQEVQQREEAARIRLKQREQQLQAQAEARLSDIQIQAGQELRRRESDLERQLDAQAREADTRLKKELQQKELEFQTKLKQRETELTTWVAAREAELRNQSTSDLRAREEDWKHQLDVQSREADTRLKKELQQKELELQAKLKQRETELTARADARETELQNQSNFESLAREEEWKHQLDAQTREADTRLKKELQQKELELQARLKQRETELTARAAVRETELQNQLTSDLRARQEDWQRQLDAQTREADTRLKKELQQKELELQAKLKQRETELTARAAVRETELQNQSTSELRARQEDWQREAESRVRATETRLGLEAQEKEELFQSKLRQRDQQWQAKLDAVRIELQAQHEQLARRRQEEVDASQRALRELESQLRKEMQRKDEAAQARARQSEQDLTAKLTAQADARQMAAREEWQKESEKKINEAVSPYMGLLDRAETERDEARQSAAVALSRANDLEKKLTEASSFLASWKNGKHLVPAGR